MDTQIKANKEDFSIGLLYFYALYILLYCAVLIKKFLIKKYLYS